MGNRKFVGVVFIIVAVILTLAIVGQVQQVFATVFGLFAIFTGKLDGYQIGLVIGHIIYWVIHFTITILLWRYGLKYIRRQAETKKSNL